MHNFEASYAALQNEVRKQKRMTLAVGLIAIAALLFGGVSRGSVLAEEGGGKLAEVANPTVVRAERFELVNAKGDLLAALKAHEDTGRPILALYDESGSPSAFLCLNRDGHPLLSFQDGEPRQRLRIYLNDDHAGQIDMFDVNKHANVEIQAGSYPHLYMRCDAKYGRVFLDTTKNGSMLKLLGEDGDNSVAVGVDSDGEPVLTMKDEQAKEVFRAPKKAD